MQKIGALLKKLSSEIALVGTGHLVAGAIISAASYIFGLELSKLSPRLQEYKWALVILIFSCLTWLVLYTWRRFDKRSPRFPEVDYSFHILRREIYYEYLSKTKFVYKRRYTLQALRNDLDGYPDRYRWTGSGTVKIRSNVPQQRIEPRPKKSLYEEFYIRFPKFLRKGQQIMAEVVWELEDAAQTAVPFASVTVLEPTDFLKIEVKLPRDFNVSEVICERSMSMGAKAPLETEVIQMDSDNRAVWEVPDPHLLHYYEMRWLQETGTEQ